MSIKQKKSDQNDYAKKLRDREKLMMPVVKASPIVGAIPRTSQDHLLVAFHASCLSSAADRHFSADPTADDGPSSVDHLRERPRRAADPRPDWTGDSRHSPLRCQRERCSRSDSNHSRRGSSSTFDWFDSLAPQLRPWCDVSGRRGLESNAERWCRTDGPRLDHRTVSDWAATSWEGRGKHQGINDSVYRWTNNRDRQVQH